MTNVFPEPALASSAQTTSSRGYVLIVDDEAANRTLLRDPLEAYGYCVAEAEDGAKALRAIDQRVPDTILLDVMMPGMDGFELCRSLKQDPRTAHVPVLMVTALSERRERLSGIEAGANDFLNKPVDIQDVALRVGNAVYAKNLFDQLAVERARSDRLLYNTLPPSIAERMRRGELSIADSHAAVTLLVADLAGFMALTSHISPDEVVSLLNEIFSTFDVLTEARGLEKLRTTGDVYMVTGGIPESWSDNPMAVVELGLEMRGAIDNFNREYRTSISLRIGISTGSVIAGVIGRHKYAYDVWGDTVNMAHALRSSGHPGAIYVCEATYSRLKDLYPFEPDGIVTEYGVAPKPRYLLRGR